MRIRTIKPEWLDDETLVLASPEARVLSIALILLADDYGNGRANPVVLAGRVFPGKVPETLANALAELEATRFVVLYEVGGQRYFAVRNWDKHQKVDKPGKPQVPPLPAESLTNNTLAKVPESPANARAVLATDQDQDQEGTRKGTDSHAGAREAPPSEAPTPRHPTGVRAEALRTGYVERFQRAMPGIGLPAVAGPGNGGPWLEVAREVTDEQVPVLLDAFFADADPFVAKDRAPSKLVGQRVRLLTQGPSQPRAARGQAKAASHEEFARLAAEGSDVRF